MADLSRTCIALDVPEASYCDCTLVVHCGTVNSWCYKLVRSWSLHTVSIWTSTLFAVEPTGKEPSRASHYNVGRVVIVSQNHTLTR